MTPWQQAWGCWGAQGGGGNLDKSQNGSLEQINAWDEKRELVSPSLLGTRAVRFQHSRSRDLSKSIPSRSTCLSFSLCHSLSLSNGERASFLCHHTISMAPLACLQWVHKELRGFTSFSDTSHCSSILPKNNSFRPPGIIEIGIYINPSMK